MTTMFRARSVLVIAAALLVLGASGCTKKPQGEPTPAGGPAGISEAKGEYTKALAKAKAWQSNADLLRVYRIFDGTLTPSQPVPLTFSFSSLIEPNKSFLVDVTPDGERDHKEDRRPFEVNFTPIDVAGWNIDPDAALKSAEEHGGQNFRQAHLAGYTVLEQLAKPTGHPLQWYFRYDTGDGTKKRLEIYLNAESGAVDTQSETTL